MKAFPLHSCGTRRSRGAALIMTLILLAMITVLVLGMASMVRNETVSSYSHEERGRALLFANMGVDIVDGILHHATMDPLDPTRAYDATKNPSRVWLSKPGALIGPVESSQSIVALTDNKLTRQIDLYSGIPSTGLLSASTPSYLQPPNLNIQTLTDQTPPTYLISDQAADPNNPVSGVVKLQVRWIYVRKDGTFDYSEQPVLTSTTNPIVGRFAYWTDDETSKINLNTAWKRNPPTPDGSQINPFSPSHPTAVNLSSIPGFATDMPDILHKAVTPAGDYSDLGSFTGGRFFNSPKEVRRLDTRFTSALNADKFEVTCYNHDPNTTFFGEPRMVLTTQEKYAPHNPDGTLAKDSTGSPYFLDVLTTENTATSTSYSDPGTVANLSATKINTTILKLMSYMSRTDWPIAPNSSLQLKYFNTTTNTRLAQLALNIIEYVRSAESAQQIIEPIRGIMRSGAFVTDWRDSSIQGADNTYKGLSRNVYISEIGVWVADSSVTIGANSNLFKCKIIYEMHLPKHFGLSQIDLSNVGGKSFFFYITPITTSVYTAFAADGTTKITGKAVRLDATDVIGGDNVTGSVLKEDGYAKVAFTCYIQATSRPTTISNLRTALMLAAPGSNKYPTDPGTRRLELLPVGTSFPAYKVDPTGTTEDKITSWQTDDPRVNVVVKDWTTNGQKPSSFGHINSAVTTLGKASTLSSTIPQQDTDNAGNLTEDGMQMPYMKGDAKNPKGIVYSSGELGFVHTGIEVSNTAATGGIPWRTIRLQPNNYANATPATTVVPDWAFMDLFTVPVDAPSLAKGIFAPHDTTSGGRINMNAQAEPFGNSAVATTPLERRTPLVAALLGVPKNIAGDLLTTTEAQKIADNIYFRTLAAKGKKYGFDTAYDSPGEVVEIQGVADGGEESEAVVRGIANLITSRGDVFTVYSIGQSVQQTRGVDKDTGKPSLIITGEHRQQVMLERYQLPMTSSASTAAPQVHFRKVSYQDLTP